MLEIQAVLKYKRLLLSLSSGILLWLSWPVSPFTFFIFFAFVPLILLADTVRRGWSYFLWCYLALLTWNIGSTWWVCNATLPGGVAAIVLNSLLMCLPWIAFYHAKKRQGLFTGLVCLVIFWTSFEYIHLNWELSWPWLTIGNVFAMHPDWVQWYEYTGSSGGTIWVMTVNILIAYTMLQYQKSPSIKYLKSIVIGTSLVLVLPFLLSFFILRNAENDYANPTGKVKNIVVVQPNIDPYMKFESGMQDGQLQTLIQLSESQIDSSTALLVWPETALNMPTGINLDKINELPYLAPLWNFLKKHAHITLLTGIEGVRFFSEENQTSSSREIPGAGYYYESYNAAMVIDTSGVSQYYNKSKLVPGVETLPSFLKVIAGWFEQFGGTGGGYTGQEERTVLNDHINGYRVAPAICYESIFGEFLTGYYRNGANLICIITNDGWWANTSGHKQHMQYARLRAIESRRWIARSANTGISCFISPTGVIEKPRYWDKAAAIKLSVPAIDEVVFFAKYGDYLSRLCLALCILFLITAVVSWVKKKLNKETVNAEKNFSQGG